MMFELQVQIKSQDQQFPSALAPTSFREFTWEDITLPCEMYTLGVCIGDGTTSIVYDAIHPDHGECAVKEFRPQYAYHMDIELPFLEAMQHHAGFMKVYDIWRNDQHSYIAMPLVDGELLELIQDGMTPQQIVDCVKQLVDAISAMHASDIVHFDLKPENIVYQRVPDGNIKYMIIDFGAAEHTDTVQSAEFQRQLNRCEITLTSLFYRSYEAVMLDGKQLHTNKSDVWALGCIIYEMITNQPLFEDLHETMGKPYNRRIFETGLKKMNELDVSFDEKMGKIKQVMQYCLKTQVDERYEAYELKDLLALNP
jgi:serine/threonine protein kinase